MNLHSLMILVMLTLLGPASLVSQQALPDGLTAEEQTMLYRIMVNRHAKRVCSEVFLAGRTAADALQNDHDTDPVGTQTVVDRENGLVTVKVPFLPGPPEGTAVYRNGLGCTILIDKTAEELRETQPARPTPVRVDLNKAWPDGESGELFAPEGLDQAPLEAALDDAFLEHRGTRGVAVVQDGRLIAERYAPGFSADRPLIIWSMTKSLTSAMVGMRVMDGKLNVQARAAVPEWSKKSDPRHGITLDHLLRMSSGLAFQEVYEVGPIDVVVMLFGQADTGAFAASKPLEFGIDEKFAYSSGTTNIIQRIVRGTFEGDQAAYVQMPVERLFKPLNMPYTVMELDEAGTFVGSSYAYSTPRDLARFGQLYLQDGVWNGKRLLPEGWVEYTVTPTPNSARREYGAQFWLNAGNPDDPKKRRWPNVPRDAYGLSGFEGQSVTVVPSRGAVIVRLGRTPDRSQFSLDSFVSAVLEALPESSR